MSGVYHRLRYRSLRQTARDMHIITRKRLNEFAAKHPRTKPGLQHWYRLMKPASFRSFAELRVTFPWKA